MPRFSLLGLIIGLLLTPLMSAAEGAEPFEVPPEEREVTAQAETEAKLDEPRELRPEEIEGFDQIKIGTTRSEAARRAKIKRDFLEGMDQIKVHSGPQSDAARKVEIEQLFRARLAEVRKEAKKLRQEESELLKQAKQAGLSIKAENAEPPKQEMPLLQFTAETQKIKHLRAAAEHLEAAEMNWIADSLTRHADAIAQSIKEKQETFEAALAAEAEKAKDPAYLDFRMGKLKSSGKIDPSALQKALQELNRLRQEAK